jgi:SAM-dependent methyltransferase
MADESLVCSSCGEDFAVEEGIPLLFCPEREDRDSVTGRIREFYEAHPFPDYEGFEDLAALLEKARAGVFARLLDEQIPFGSRVLDCGCGTGQLSNFLGIAHRSVIGTDLSVASLRLAESFRRGHRLDRVYFLQMSLFKPVFPPRSFDYVICNGVLHHTHDPQAGFRKLAELVRPGGYLLVGLYHRYGRLATDLRRVLFRWFGRRLSFLDPRFRRRALGEGRWEAWFADQYRNPHESKHTIGEAIRWVESVGMEWVRSIPGTRLLADFSAEEELFRPDPPAGSWERGIKECLRALHGSGEGGFFSFIARRRP